MKAKHEARVGRCPGNTEKATDGAVNEAALAPVRRPAKASQDHKLTSPLRALRPRPRRQAIPWRLISRCA